MDKAKQLEHAAGDEQFVFVYPEPVKRVKFALRLPRKVASRELLAVINAYDPAGFNITSEAKPISYSNELESWFHYIPAGDAKELREFATLDFSSPAARISIRMYDWHARKMVTDISSFSITCIFTLSDPGNDNTVMTNVVFSNGGHHLE